MESHDLRYDSCESTQFVPYFIMTMAQERVTVAVACKTLGISQRSLYRLLKEGRLTRIKEGCRTYILTSEVYAMRIVMKKFKIDANAYYNRGTAYGKKGQYDEAILDYNKVIELNPNDAEAYRDRGNCLL